MWLKSINTFFINLIKQFSSLENACLCLEKIVFMIAFNAINADLIGNMMFNQLTKTIL